MQFTEAIRNFEGQPLTRQILLYLLKDYRRPSDKITELVKQGILRQVKAKVYIPGPGLKMRGPEPFLLSNHLAAPSYVSMESALAYYRLIPERVYGITAAITGRSRAYTTPAGRFRFEHLPLPYFSFGQLSVELAPGQTVLMARAEKALCDTVVVTAGLQLRSRAAAKEWLLEDMRMDSELLRSLDAAIIREWIAEAPKAGSLQQLVKALEHL
jgi:predicted transcriptional regulator of viral defense system